jgi:hypothetical protein
MKAIIFLTSILFLTTHVLLVAQTGPGGVGQNNGSTSLKIWYRTDFGVSTTGASIDAITNSAGIAALDISETGAQRPTLVTGAVNGYNEISFSGSNRLRTGLTLTTTNFVNDQASSFVVCRADNTTQTSCVYTTDPLVSSTRFSNHIPWSNTVYFDIGTCCGTNARVQQGGLTGLNNYSVWSYDALAATGKQLYRNGILLQNVAGTSTYNSHATHRFNIGGNTSGSNGFAGDVTEIIVFNNKINTAQRIIIENYLAAKYGLTLGANDIYTQDNPGNGNYDHDVAGIGRVNASNLHDDAQGTGIVRIVNPTNLDNNEFLMWGHNNGVQQAIEIADVPFPVQARFDRVWRVSEVNSTSTAVDVGNIDIRFDLTGLGSVTASDLRLLVDTDNDGFFNDETPISGATSLGSNIYEFSGVSAIANNLRFTIGTINSSQTPLPIELVYFNVIPQNNRSVKLEWQTASEINNDFFTVERSLNGIDWEIIAKVNGAGNSNMMLTYSIVDQTPYFGISYYRLKQTDFDGQFEYSSIKSVNFKITELNNVQIYPNPTNNVFTVNGNPEELAEIKITNALGQEVTNLIYITHENGSTLLIDLSNLSQGLYYVKTRTTTNSVYKK